MPVPLGGGVPPSPSQAGLKPIPLGGGVPPSPSSLSGVMPVPLGGGVPPSSGQLGTMPIPLGGGVPLSPSSPLNATRPLNVSSDFPTPEEWWKRMEDKINKFR